MNIFVFTQLYDERYLNRFTDMQTKTLFSGVTKVGRILSRRPVHFATLVTWRRKQGRGTPLTSSAEIKISTPRTGVRRGRGRRRTTSRTNYQSEISRTTSGCLETPAVHRFDFLFDLIHFPSGFEKRLLLDTSCLHFWQKEPNWYPIRF